MMKWLPYAAQLAVELESLEDVTLHLIGVAGEKGPAVFLADATLYLELFAIWPWDGSGCYRRSACRRPCKATYQNRKRISIRVNGLPSATSSNMSSPRHKVWHNG